jgi:hypothetical protein
MSQAISHTLISFAYLLLYIACGVVIVRRFRGSPGAVLGGIAFGIWAAGVFSRLVMSPLHIGWGPYWLVNSLIHMAAAGCLLAAFVIGLASAQAPGTSGTRSTTETEE